MAMRVLAVLGLAGAVAACGGGAESNTQSGAAAATSEGAAKPKATQRQTIGDALTGSGEHSRFMQAAESAGIAQTLKGAGPYTVFAPSNAAFEQAGAPPQGPQLTALLTNHIVPGTVTVEDLRRAAERGPNGRAEIASVGGGTLTVSRDGEAVVLSDGRNGQVRITGADQVHANGVVHTVDGLLQPSAG